MNLEKNVLPEIKRAIKELKEIRVSLAAKTPAVRVEGIKALQHLGLRLKGLEFVDGFAAANSLVEALDAAGYGAPGIKSFETSARHLGEGKYSIGTWVTVQLFVPAAKPRKGKVK